MPIAEHGASEAAGTDRAKNTVVLGLLAGWFGIGARGGRCAGIRKSFAKKGADVVAGNERAFAAGLEYAAAHPLHDARARWSAPAPAAAPSC